MSHEIDCWERWLLHTRFRGPHGKEALEFLTSIRDRVLNHADPRPGDCVLDVGSGDGLLAFGALHRIAPGGVVILDDVSQDLLDACAKLAVEAGVEDRLRFICNSAEDLRDIPSGSVDIVLTRSVLLYVQNKEAAAQEFHRVLRPSGRISLFEPINRPGLAAPRFGIDPGPIRDLAERVEETFRTLQPRETDPLVDFDERDLVRIFETAGFSQLNLELHMTVRRERRTASWFEALLDQPSHPRIPSLRQAIAAALDPYEAAAYMGYYRQAITTTPVITRQALSYLNGVR